MLSTCLSAASETALASAMGIGAGSTPVPTCQTASQLKTWVMKEIAGSVVQHPQHIYVYIMY